MKSTRMVVLWLVAAAWLFTGTEVLGQTSNLDAVLTLDYVGADASTGNKTDDGVTGGVVAGAGTAVVIEVFANPVTTGLSGANFSLTADNTQITMDSAANANMDTPFGIKLPGTATAQSVGSLTGPVTPTAGYLGAITLVTVADVTGVEFSVTVSVELAASATDKRTISQTMAFNAVPKAAADVSIVEIPRGGVSPAITVTASGFPAGAVVSFTVTSTGGTATISDTDNGDGTLTLTASGSGAATADVTASDGTTTTAAVSVTFSEQVPAELASFGGSVLEESVALNWTTVSQTNNAGWQVMRSTDGITYEVVSDFIPGAGTSDAVLNYGFKDSNVPGVEKVFYRLDQLDLDGAIHSSAPIEVILGARFLDLPTEFGTHIYPNPFNPATTIAYDLPSESAVSIVIYDALGQEVRRLVTEQKNAGRYTVQWDALDNLGRGVGSGVYIAKVEAGQFSASQKMLLLK
jgi:hypothetical protein